MNNTEQNLIYGVGSPNGDDQIGWIVVEKIRSRLPEGWNAKWGLVPMDLLNHLECVCELHIVDACEGEEAIGTVHRVEWPGQKLVTKSVATSHDFALSMTLELAASLGILPLHVTIWGIVGKRFAPSDSISFSERDSQNIVEAIHHFISLEDISRA